MPKLPFSDAEAERYLLAMEFTPSGRVATTSRLDRYPGIQFQPPKVVADAALQALRWKFEQGHTGGTDIGVGRAVQLARQMPVPPRDIDRMVNYFSRHGKDLLSVRAVSGEITPGVLAWGLWGGDKGKVWAEHVRAQMDNYERGHR